MKGNAKLTSNRDSDIRCVAMLIVIEAKPRIISGLVAADIKSDSTFDEESSALPT